MSFARIAGQEDAKALARVWLRSRRLPHAVLLSGPAGTGKRQLALEVAKAVNCQQGGDEACDHCLSCRRVDSLSHPDVQALLPLPKGRKDREPPPPPWEEVWAEVRPVAQEYLQQCGPLPRSAVNIPKSYLLSLQREMAYAPGDGPWKVGLIFEAERMHPAGANALLKILEEPPRHALFLLVSAAPEQLLPTVLSRCQRLLCRPLSQAVLRAQLEAEGVPAERLELAVRLGAGSLERARWVGSGQAEARRSQVEAFLAGGAKAEDEVYWPLLEELGGRAERGQLEEFLGLAAVYLRDLFLLQHGRPELVVQVDRRSFLEELRSLLPARRVEEAALAVDQAFALLSGNVSVPLILAELWHLLRSGRTNPTGGRP